MNPQTQPPAPLPEHIPAACPICLEAPSFDLALIDPCFHAFCLFCILQWTEFQHHLNGNHGEAPPCPICRTRFTSVLTNLDLAQKTYERVSVVTEAPPHWSQFYKTRVQEPTHKMFRLGLHHRRLVYAQNLQPLLEFNVAAVQMTKKLSSKLDSWLQRELCLLLHHREMATNYSNSQLQKEETLILSELTKALVSENLPELHALLTNHTTGKGIQKMVCELQGFFFDRTEKFIKELATFIHSPYDMHAYDRNVKYI